MLAASNDGGGGETNKTLCWLPWELNREDLP
jgi:hypothetical protein